jgi:acetoin utilization protein AcuB
MPTERDLASVRSSIDHFMTPDPTCIQQDQPIAAAHERMRAHGIRHLPVLDRGRLVGVVSQRDLFFHETRRDVDPSKVTVNDAMTIDVYVVPPERPVGEVAAKMVQDKCGSAVVTRGDQIVGIFTTTDALRVLGGIVEAWR